MASSARRRKRKPPSRRSRLSDSSDEDFQIEDASSSLAEDDADASDDPKVRTPSETRRKKKRNAPARSRPRAGRRLATSSDEDFEIDDDGSSLDDEDRLASDPQDEGAETTAQAVRRPTKRPRQSSRRSRPTRRKPRFARSRSHIAHFSDEDFEIDDEDENSDEDQAEVDMAPIVTRSSKRHSTRITGRDGGQSSSSQAAEKGKEEPLQTTRRGIHSDEASEKGKGKQKVVVTEATNTARELTGEESAPVCGVCLSEELGIERGKLDCCDHFFCFGCIMEWAKVESRCPMCKQRFVTIVRAGSAASKRTRTVRIPMRDQVYIPPEDEDVAVDDPYADIVCMECQETGEEGLLLLCDQCDSAAHTYCVGLGRSVPRGDWFCRSCQTLTAESSGSEDDEEEIVLDYSDDVEDSVLRDIVTSAEAERQQTTRQTRVQRASTSATRALPSAARRARSGVRRTLWRHVSGRRRNRSAAAPRLSQAARASMGDLESAEDQHSHVLTTQSGPARTVPQQRRLQERIQMMRDNWGSIQEGALQFTAIGVQSRAPAQDVTHRDGRGFASQVVQPSPRSASAVAAKEENHRTVVNLSSTPVSPAFGGECSRHQDCEVKQAWRMMDRAKPFLFGTTPSGQQKFTGSQQDLRVSARRMSSEEVRSCIKSTRKVIEDNGRSTSNSLSLARTPDTRMKISSLPNSTDNNVFMHNPVQNSTPETVCRTNLGMEHVLEEVESGLHPNMSNSQMFFHKSRPEVGDTRGNHEERSKQQVPRGIVSCSTTKANATAQFAVEPSSEVPRPIGKQEIQIPEKEVERKQAVSKRDFEAGKLPKNNEDCAEEEHVANANSSHASVGRGKKGEGLKARLAEMVKTQLWPLYLSERLGKEQFKEIARSAVHTLLDLFRINGKSNSNCNHMELQGESLIAGCCNNCVKLQVEKIVRSTKAKVQI